MLHRAWPLAVVTVLLACPACSSSPYREVEVDLGHAATTSRGAPATAVVVAGEPQAFRFSVAAIESPRDTYEGYSRLFALIGQRLGRKVEFVQRKTYREVNDLLLAGKLDAALVCTGGYLDLERRAPGAVEVAGVPVVRGRSTYRSLVVVPRDSPVQRLEDLAGRRFAFTDELSFSGRAYVVGALRRRGLDPEHLFAATVLTYSHDRSIHAVADHLVDAAAVHSRIYERLVARDPGLGARTRVIHTSPEFGTMPVVVSTRLPEAVRAQLRATLLGLVADPDAADALRKVELDGFVAPPQDLFATAQQATEPAR